MPDNNLELRRKFFQEYLDFYAEKYGDKLPESKSKPVPEANPKAENQPVLLPDSQQKSGG